MSETLLDDQAELDESPLEEEAREGDEAFACPDCERSFKTKVGLAYHRRRTHGTPGESAEKNERRKTSPAPARGSQGVRKRKVKETLDELADTIDDLQGRHDAGEPLSFPDMLRTYGDGIAGSLAWSAERLTPLGSVIDRMLGHGGLITIAQGFLRPGRWMVTRWRGWAAERSQQEEPLFSEPGAPGGGQPVEPTG